MSLPSDHHLEADISFQTKQINFRMEFVSDHREQDKMKDREEKGVSHILLFGNKKRNQRRIKEEELSGEKKKKEPDPADIPFQTFFVDTKVWRRSRRRKRGISIWQMFSLSPDAVFGREMIQ